MGSVRLPGKVLRPFGASTLLGHIVDRLSSAAAVHVATTVAPADEQVAQVAAAHGAAVFRGAEDDVLGRFASCVEAMPATPDLVVRMAADRPFASARLVSDLLEAYDDAGRPDYLSNTLPRKSYPDGFDAEVVRTSALLEAANEASEPYEREHVTPFLYRRPERFSLAGIACPYGNFSHVRATIDTEEDYVALVAVERRLGSDGDWRDLLALALLEPELFP